MFKNCSNMNFDYHVAFSRDQKEKIYVQHLIKEKSEFIYDMVFDKRCYVFLVGNSKVLPKSIDKALKHVFCQINKDKDVLDEEWNKILYSLKKSGRFYIETW
jgi:sulfite reductase alpha subunit-like flavoprotein